MLRREPAERTTILGIGVTEQQKRPTKAAYLHYPSVVVDAVWR